MMELEHGAATPLKTLEKRVALLQQIDGFGPEVKQYSLDQLKERIDLIETINRLEPGEPNPIKKLRERARLLERIEAAEPMAEEPADETAAELEDA